MKRLLALIPGLVLAAVAVAQPDLPADVKKLQGVWVMTTAEKDGAKVAVDQVKASKITYKGMEVIVETPHQAKEPIKVKLTRVDSTKKPAEMDWVRENGPDAGKVMLAIYEFSDGDHYRICFGSGGKDRPTAFSTKEGSGHFLHEWKRAK